MIDACQSSTGSWLAIIVDDSWLRSSMISRMSRLSTGLSGAVPQSSRIRPSDQDILRASNPIASGKVNHEVSIQAAWLPIIDIFYACRKTQLGRLEQSGQPPVLPVCPFVVNHQAEALVEGQFIYVGSFPLRRVRFAHPSQAHVI